MQNYKILERENKFHKKWGNVELFQFFLHFNTDSCASTPANEFCAAEVHDFNDHFGVTEFLSPRREIVILSVAKNLN
jgi:hypothetical protein